jgi:hypothetical protein
MSWKLSITAPVMAGVIVAGGAVAMAAGVKNSPPPVSGKWGVQVTGHHGYGSGQFVVTPHHKAVSGFAVKPGAYAASACGTDPLKVRGKPGIVHFTGIDHYHLHYSIWAVAKKAKGKGDPIKPRRVTFIRGKDQVTGKLELSFNRPRGGGITRTGPPKSNGQLSFRVKGEGRCGLGFFFKKN